MAERKTTGKRNWRPHPSNPEFTEIGLRVLISEADVIQAAAEALAKRTSVPVSRNTFCAQAVIAAARKELARNS